MLRLRLKFTNLGMETQSLSGLGSPRAERMGTQSSSQLTGLKGRPPGLAPSGAAVQLTVRQAAMDS